MESEDGDLRLVPCLIDHRARTGYSRPYASLPKTVDVKDGFNDISYQTLAAAVNRIAWLLKDKIPKSRPFEPFVYIGGNDMRYHLLALAAIKTGHVVFFTSPRNSLEGQNQMLSELDCKFFLSPAAAPPVVSQLVKDRGMQHVIVPELSELLSDDPVRPFPLDQSLDQIRHVPFAVVHTSGSTGIPKLITYTNGFLAAFFGIRQLAKRGSPPSFLEEFVHRRWFLPFPGFHAAGLTWSIGHAIEFEATLVYPPPGGPPTADLVNSMHEHANIGASLLPPSLIVDLVKNPVFYENLSKIELFSTGGSALPQSAGDALCQKSRLLPSVGITEAGTLHSQAVDSADWDWYKFCPFVGAEFRQSTPELYELIVVRRPDTEDNQPVFQLFPELNEWPTKDLYEKHPTKPDLWGHRGRADDIIVFSNGEKLNPLTMEGIVGSDPAVSAALVFGAGQFNAGLLIEPAKPVDDNKALLDQIWPTIEKANQSTVAHGKISKDFVIFTNADRPLARAGKGSVQRQPSVKMYSEEIEKLYKTLDTTNDSANGELDLSNEQAAQASIQKIIQQQTGTTFAPTVDLFHQGFDSLQVINLARTLSRRGVRVEPSTVYSHPTIVKLAGALSSPTTNGVLSRKEEISNILQKLSSELPVSTRRPQPRPAKATVLLTGFTGSLGSYLLENLLMRPNVEKVICLGRAGHAAAKKHWDPSWENVEYLRIDIGAPRFGLDVLSYRSLCSSVTHILHAAWTVDFNASLSTMTPHIAGAANMVRLHEDSTHGAFIYFVSTIGAVQAWSGGDRVPEQIFNDPDVSPGGGYTDSKHVAERYLAEAQRVSESPLGAICRVGQIAGPVLSKDGTWAKQEWLPTLMESSKELGLLPDEPPATKIVDWVPVDMLALEMVDLMFVAADAEKTSNITVHHIVNPHKTAWPELLPTIQARLPGSVKVVPSHEWIAALKAAADKPDADASRLPALKLLPFFEMSGSSLDRTLDTTFTETQSTSLSQLRPVSREWMDLWMTQWGYTS